MNRKKVDYLIIGQGLAGSALAMESLRRGKKILVIDEPERNRASVISAGICNPITGKQMTKTYLADRLFPHLHEWYSHAEEVLGERFFESMPIYRPFLSLLEQQQWLVKSTEETVRNFVERVWEQPLLSDVLNNPFGGLEIKQSGRLEVAKWVAAVRQMLIDMESYRADFFDESEVLMGDEVNYRDIEASHLILCTGLENRDGKLFAWLPLRPLKGEILEVRINFLPTGRIISRGVYLAPSSESGVFVVGSTYQHEPYSSSISKDGEAQLRRRLDKLVRAPYEVVNQYWGIRPTVIDRRPLLGSHPGFPKATIFNGLGTKGVSLAPYFAGAMIDWIEKGIALPEEVNISRFKALYSN